MFSCNFYNFLKHHNNIQTGTLSFESAALKCPLSNFLLLFSLFNDITYHEKNSSLIKLAQQKRTFSTYTHTLNANIYSVQY